MSFLFMSKQSQNRAISKLLLNTWILLLFILQITIKTEQNDGKDQWDFLWSKQVTSSESFPLEYIYCMQSYKITGP